MSKTVTVHVVRTLTSAIDIDVPAGSPFPETDALEAACQMTLDEPGWEEEVKWNTSPPMWEETE